MTQGGYFPPAWMELLRTCVEHGLDVENGLHVFLADDPELAGLAAERGVELRDLRRPPAGLSTATGENLAVDATIVLTVGSDCAIGKMTVSCELDLEARRRGLRSVFVPTGQTGMVIAGWGIAVDAVVADFVAGAAERLVVEGAERGGELLWVEGQGSLLHPVYSGVALGLYHGSVPHLLVLCHEVGRTEIEGAGGGPHPIPPLRDLVELHERLALPARPARVAAVALNTRALGEEEARAAIAAAEDGDRELPADDPRPLRSREARRRRALAAAHLDNRTPVRLPCEQMFGKLLILVCVAALAVGLAARGSSGAGPKQTYVVRPGDTLWSVAQRTYAGDPRQGVWELQHRNHLATATIVPGEKLVVP